MGYRRRQKGFTPTPENLTIYGGDERFSWSEFRPPKECRNLIGKKIHELSQGGFTLIEIMVTVAILTFGVVAIYQSLFISLDTYSLYSHHLSVLHRMDEILWTTREDLLRTRSLIPGETGDRIADENKAFDWHLSILPMNIEVGLYRLRLTFSWQEGKRTINVLRETYALAPPLPKEEEK
jgi:prepilin-type N-terminal cleavage/methylation domain-containing protein